MEQILSSGKVIGNMGGQVLDLYNQKVQDNISTTILTTIDSSSQTFVTVMDKSKTFIANNGEKYDIAIRKYTPRECFRLMGVHDEDIDKILSNDGDKQIIPNSKLYQLAGNSIVTNCMVAMFEELFFPSGQSYVEKDGQLSLF